jgi:hypothetical protein
LIQSNVNLLGENIDIINIGKRNLSHASKKFGPELGAEIDTNISCYHHAGKNHNLMIASKYGRVPIF